MDRMIKGLHHAAISVQDLDRSIEFYCGLLGMHVEAQGPFGGDVMDRITGLSGARGRSAMLRAGDLRLEVFEFSSPVPVPCTSVRPVNDHGISHFCIVVADLQSEYERLRSAGVGFHCAPQPFGHMSATYGRDPDGNVFELLEIAQSSDRSSERNSYVAADGSIHIQDLTLAPSALWSSQYRAFQTSVAQAVSGLQPLRAPARDASREQWQEFDAAWDQRCNALPLRTARQRYPVCVTETAIAGVRAAIITPEEGVAAENEHRVLINLRGGGFVYNRGLSFGQLESIPVACCAKMEVITLDYRQAPFHSYPAATEDVVAVYGELLQQYEPRAIGIFGCSAGATLVAQSVARFQDCNLPPPGAIGMACMAPMPYGDRPPWGAAWGDSSIWYAGVVPKNEMSADDRAFWEPVLWYMEEARPDDPHAYPGASDAVLAKFPPTLFLSGTRDFALSSVVFTHARLLRLGVQSNLYVIEGGAHGTYVVAVDTPEARDAHAYIAQWFQERLA